MTARQYNYDSEKEAFVELAPELAPGLTHKSQPELSLSLDLVTKSPKCHKARCKSGASVKLRDIGQDRMQDWVQESKGRNLDMRVRVMYS